MYGEENIYAYTPEIGTWNDGFWPESERILPLAEENLYPNKFAAWAVGAAYTSEIELNEDYYEQGSSYSMQVVVKNIGLEGSNGDVFLNVSSPISLNTEYNIGYLESQAGITINYDFTVPINMPDGEVVEFVISVHDGIGFSFTKKETVFIGEPELFFIDGAENGMDNWISTGWGLTTDNYSDSYSFTDSPEGEYENGSHGHQWHINRFLIEQPFNFTEVAGGYLQFMAKWEIEAGYDWVQVIALINDMDTEIPLIGNLMSGGSGTGVQSPGQYGYDGTSGWEQDILPLNQFAGEEEVWIEFRLVSDGGVNSDGFYVDDIQLFTYSFPDQVMGDLNEDGTLNVLDVVQLVNIILNATPTDDEFEIGDMNTDQNLNVLDIVIMVNMILNI